MNVRLILAALLTPLAIPTIIAAQCYDSVYYAPPVYTTPIYSLPSTIPYTAPSPVTSLASPIYHNIHYSGTVRSKEYVDAVLPNGKKMKVPVINGIAPFINSKCTAGSEVYDFTYNSQDRWSGKTPIYYDAEKKSPPVVTETVEKRQQYDDYKGRKIGIEEWTERSPAITESPAPKTVPGPSFHDEIQRVQDLYTRQQKLKDEQYAAEQKLKDDRYNDTIERLNANLAELRAMVKKLEEKVPPPTVTPPKIEVAPPPRIAPGMKKPSEIENPKGT